jgi:tyrosine-protein kinase Etk/Wzc
MATDTSMPGLQNHPSVQPASPGPVRSDDHSEEISLLDLLIVIAEHKGIVVAITAVFAIAAIIVSLLLPKEYTSTVTLLTPQQNSSLNNQLAAQLGGFAGAAAVAAVGANGLLRNPNDLYVGMLKSRTVEDATIAHFGLMQEYHRKYLSDARKSLEQHVTIDGSGKDSLIHISVEDRNPQRASELANGYVDQFRELSQHLAITEAQLRRQFFENQLKQANQNLADAEEALKETEQKTGLIEVGGQARALIDSAAALRAQITAKEVQIQGMQTYATGQNAQLVEAQQELDSLRAQLVKLGGSSENPDAIIVPKGQMTAAGVELIRRQRDEKYYETIFEALARQFELAKLDEAKEGAVIQVVDAAIPADRKSSPKRTLIVIGATFLGFIVGVFWVLWRAALDHMRSDPETSPKLSLLRRALSVRTRGTQPG